MAEMIRPGRPAALGPEFEPFLFAPIHDGAGNMPLSILSALARLDLDPWEEAARLARLPVAEAARKLTGLIAALPDASAIPPDLPETVARLIALLPRSDHPIPDHPPKEASTAGGVATRQKSATRVILINVVLIGVAIGIQGFIAWHNQPLHLEPGHAPIAETHPSQVEPPIAGQ